MPTSNGNGHVHARHVTKQPIQTHATLSLVANAVQMVWKKATTQPHTHKPNRVRRHCRGTNADTYHRQQSAPVIVEATNPAKALPPHPSFVSQDQDGEEEEDPENEEAGKENYRNTHKVASKVGKNARQGEGQTNRE